MATNDTLIKYLKRKMAYEERKLVSLMPQEYVTLKEAFEEKKYVVKLYSGDVHHLDPREVEELARRLPWYLHRLVKLPIVLVYRKTSTLGYFRVAGDKWACYAVGILLRNTLWYCPDRIKYDEAKRLIGMFKSVFLVTIELESLRVGSESYDYEEH